MDDPTQIPDLLLTAVLTGMRDGELCGLRFSQIRSGAHENDFGELTVNRTIRETGSRRAGTYKWGHKDRTKSKKYRTIPVDPRVIRIAQNRAIKMAADARTLSVRMPDDPYVFPRTWPGRNRSNRHSSRARSVASRPEQASIADSTICGGTQSPRCWAPGTTLALLPTSTGVPIPPSPCVATPFSQRHRPRSRRSRRANDSYEPGRPTPRPELLTLQGLGQLVGPASGASSSLEVSFPRPSMLGSHKGRRPRPFFASDEWRLSVRPVGYVNPLATIPSWTEDQALSWSQLSISTATHGLVS